MASVNLHEKPTTNKTKTNQKHGQVVKSNGVKKYHRLQRQSLFCSFFVFLTEKTSVWVTCAQSGEGYVLFLSLSLCGWTFLDMAQRREKAVIRAASFFVLFFCRSIHLLLTALSKGNALKYCPGSALCK